MTLKSFLWQEGRIALSECDAKKHLIPLTQSSNAEMRQLSSQCIKLLSQDGSE
jgi:hypothetical protein